MLRPPRLLPVAFAVLLAASNGAAVDVIPSAASVAERLRDVEAVLHVRPVSEAVVRAEDSAPALQAANPEVRIRGPLLSPVIEQDVQVLEVMKGQELAVVGTTIRIGTSGGHDGMNLSENWRQRTLNVGSEYILFLSPNRQTKELLYSFFDIYRLNATGVTEPFGLTQYGKTLVGMIPPDALEFIRKSSVTGP